MKKHSTLSGQIYKKGVPGRMHNQSHLSRFKHFLVAILLLLMPDFVLAVSTGISSRGNVYITINDDEYYYEITPQQLGVGVIHNVEYQGQPEFDAENVQLVYRFFFYTSAGLITVKIREPSGHIYIDPPLSRVIRFKMHMHYLEM